MGEVFCSPVAAARPPVKSRAHGRHKRSGLNFVAGALSQPAHKIMKMLALVSCCALAVILAGCETRSISDSGYRSDSSIRYKPRLNEFKGELNEMDVLGIESNPKITEQDISSTLDKAGRVRIRKGSNVLLVQSGAVYPDEPMIEGLKDSIIVTPFNGQPGQFQKENHNKALRFAAARGGCETILCYWGVLESSRQNLDSKFVSWVPVVGSVVPDEHQHMRIRLRIAIVDVRTGHWAMFSPEPFVDSAVSMRLGRERSDQAQVNRLKQSAYAAATRDLLKLYLN